MDYGHGYTATTKALAKSEMERRQRVVGKCHR